MNKNKNYFVQRLLNGLIIFQDASSVNKLGSASDAGAKEKWKGRWIYRAKNSRTHETVERLGSKKREITSKV